MFSYGLPTDPPCDEWEEYGKPTFINDKIYEICSNILRKKDKSDFSDIKDLIYTYIQEHLEEFLEE
jgi:hypothetical protein